MPTIIVGIPRFNTSLKRVRRGTSEIDRAIDSNRIIGILTKIEAYIASPFVIHASYIKIMHPIYNFVHSIPRPLVCRIPKR